MIQPCLLRSPPFLSACPLGKSAQVKNLVPLVTFSCFLQINISSRGVKGRSNRTYTLERRPRRRQKRDVRIPLNPTSDWISARMQIARPCFETRCFTQERSKMTSCGILETADNRPATWHRFILRPRFIAGNYANFWEPFDQSLQDNYLFLRVIRSFNKNEGRRRCWGIRSRSTIFSERTRNDDGAFECTTVQ